MKRNWLLTLGVVLAVNLMSSFAAADNFSFLGNFQHDNDVQAFGFNVGALSNVTLRAYSYGGGTNAAGQVIAPGGFDTILVLWDSNGNFITRNDDGGCIGQGGFVNPDPVTGECWDTYLNLNLNAGNYTVTIEQYNNFNAGNNLADGFFHDGAAGTWFTDGFFPGGCANHFQDVSGSAGRCRNNDWAFDVLNVNEAIQDTPEPASLVLLGSGLVGLGGAVRRKLIAR